VHHVELKFTAVINDIAFDFVNSLCIYKTEQNMVINGKEMISYKHIGGWFGCFKVYTPV